MKKLLLGLGSAAAIVTPVVAVVSCGQEDIKKAKQEVKNVGSEIKTGAEKAVDVVKHEAEKAVDAIKQASEKAKEDADYLAWYQERMEDSKTWDALAKAELDLEAQEAAAQTAQQPVVAEQPKVDTPVVEMTIEQKFDAALTKALNYIKDNYKRDNIAFEPGIGFKINIQPLEDVSIVVAFSFDPTVDPVMQWRSKMGAGAIKDLFENSNHEINFSNMKDEDLAAISAEDIADKSNPAHDEVNNHRFNTLEYWLAEIKLVISKINDIAYVSLEDAIDAKSSIEVSTVENWSKSLPAIISFPIL